jgi:tetrapyrrole methylase family protein/MazG family protein
MKNNFERLVEIMSLLRSENGCPWDRVQTHQSLLPYLIEEAYEVLDSVEAEDDSKLKEELGDLLLQVVFHSQIAREEGRFDIEEVIENLISKLKVRHPHVFKNKEKLTPQQVVDNWEHIKKKTKNRMVLSGIPRELPALIKAFRVQEKVGRLGFDWQKADDIFEKIEEEIGEFKDVRKKKNEKELEGELGDIFFSLVNLSRHLGINPEMVLRKTISKFTKRFNYIEKELSKKGKSLKETSLAEMDRLWEEAKRI